MTLEEAIKRYTSDSFYEKSDGDLQGYLEFNQLAEWLKELKQLREQTQWIPVSERLPEKNDVYLVAVQAFGYPRRDVDGFIGQTPRKWELYGSKVVAWMPLPEPYKEERGE